MPELRIDPVCGRQVYVAEERLGRPFDYAPPVSASGIGEPVDPRRRKARCPFCAGNESDTPDAAATVTGDDSSWRVRVVPNKYPAVSLDALCDFDDRAKSNDKGQPALGVHEVIIESPNHVEDFAKLGLDQLTVVLGTYRDRLRHWAADVRVRHGMVFKNAGFDAGASLEHVHSQFMAFPEAPPTVAAELAGAKQFYDSRGRCVFCDLAQQEVTDGLRIVAAAHGYLAFCAFAGRQPYEMWILPDRHEARFDTLADSELPGLGIVLIEALERLSIVCERSNYKLAYNLVLHTAPFDQAYDSSYHWHWELIPRVTHLAGLEWGAGLHINPISPERAAQDLRGASPGALASVTSA